MPLVTTRLVLINARVTQDGQEMDKTALILTSVRLDFTCALKIHIARTTRVVTRVLVTGDGSVNGLNHTVDVPGVTRPRFVLVMDNVCEMGHVIVSAITAAKTARCAIHTFGVQAMEHVTSMGRVTVNMAGRDNRWTAVFVFRSSCAVVMAHVTTTLRVTRTSLVSVMTATLAITAAKVRY